MPSLINSLLALLFPDRCAGCGRLGHLFCPTCDVALQPYISGMRVVPAGLTAVEIAFVYQNPVREAIHQLKYARRQRVGAPLGVLLAEQLCARLPGDAAVLAVPLHPARLAERGFNQSEVLAQALAERLKLPLVRRGLRRVRATEQQARMDTRERQENMRGAFTWRAATPPPPRILLIDDVLTTGATMAACATALRTAGATEVYGIALARSVLS